MKWGGRGVCVHLENEATAVILTMAVLENYMWRFLFTLLLFLNVLMAV